MSVLVPVHNDALYVTEALASVVSQTYGRWECVVVDDASEDESWALIDAETSRDRRFVSKRNSVNRGPGGARNDALSLATGDYVVFLDGDDLLMRASLGDRVAALAPHVPDPFVAGSFCGVRFSPETTRLEDLATHYRSTQPSFMDFVVAGGEVPFPMTAPLVRTAVLRAIGGFDESMTTGGVDWDLWYRLLRNGYVFVSSPHQSVVYRQRAGGITRTNPAAHTRAAARLIAAAHEPVTPDIIVTPTDYPMTEPLGWYQSTLTIAERAVRFAAMALADGDAEAMRATLEALPVGTWPLLERHLDMPSLVARGVARSLGVPPSSLDGAADALAPFVLAVTAAVRERVE